MWKRKELKRRAKKILKKNYWTAIVVCFFIALLTGEFGTSILGIWQSEDSVDPNYIIKNNNISMINKENYDKYIETIQQIEKTEEIKNKLNEIQLKIWQIAKDTVNSSTKSYKYIFKIWDAVKSFNLNQEYLGISISLTAVISLLFTIIIADPFTVAGRRYFLNISEGGDTKITVLGKIFKKGKWINVAVTMLFKRVYLMLWYLTIIGGIVKKYEYIMIPYILAENPNIRRKDAFKLSKKMMKGNKFNTFILDMSFLGWNILSIFTFGILNLLYVNPYSIATKTELYITLRNNTINKQDDNIEILNEK